MSDSVAPLTADKLAELRDRVARLDCQDLAHHSWYGALLATIDADRTEIARLSKIEERAKVELRLQVSRKGKRHSRSTLKEIELNDTLINVLMDILEGGKDG